MRYSQVMSRSKQVLLAGRIPFVLGGPGLGKTAMFSHLAEDLGAKFIPEEASQRDTVDVRGLPMIHDGATLITKPDLIYDIEQAFQEGAKKVLVGIDEFTSGIRAVQVGYQQIVKEKRIGRHAIPNPDQVMFMLAGNTGKDRTEYHQITAPLANRCVFFELEPNVDDLVAWGLESGRLHGVVVGLLRFKPNLIYTFEGSVYGKEGRYAFATPRTWESVSALLQHGSKADDAMLFSGCVGPGPAGEMAAFWKSFGEIDTPQEILKDPKAARVPKNASALFAVCGALASHISKKEQQDPLVAYALRLPPDFQTILFRDIIVKMTSFIQNKEFAKWIQSHTDFIV